VSAQEQKEGDEADSKVVISLRSSLLRRLFAGAVAAVLGAGGGAAERRLTPAPDTSVEHANEVLELRLRVGQLESLRAEVTALKAEQAALTLHVQRLDDAQKVALERRAEDLARIRELEGQARPAGYRPH
jgi:hypothetical protein